ncbi:MULTISPECIES: pyruvate kinase [Prochlorococcus]|uniref:Pyruvate kinase n=1 Tax=Prochlorococcus marinus (strain SARG / CCMP1375 / SS120) TaxID=167539 RepID=Q7VC19_PROMA|nr:MULTISPECIES: pyruvate kinase [Prochlorococcus]AAP99967.1 Pyruvate kinase [Prochlorococcus marinus subsp. marinus str. CCMP1375]KGG11689.1 Pyruvate kinase [Prochlorococcus marinus str. LG]KGG18899.1 Pyruvate kinase [Prochlorococcus marinus str. SS2]KGG23563.1 Pyruvate kinase [Prochlorococcus marinus str. SS35]KGG32201.1 Pyruvate kinase [Prochlorococcus marinus str. SS51]
MTTIDLKRRTKIVATIGPATESPEKITELIKAGATTFRLNFSHGDHEEHAKRIKTIRSVASDLGVNIGILQDLQGPKIRLGRFKEGPVNLKTGDVFALTSENKDCNQEIANVTYENLVNEVEKGKRILLDDGRVEMIVENVDKKNKSLICKVTVGGILSNNKGVNFPDVQLSINALTEKDKIDLSFGLKQGVDWVALSFVRNPADIQEIKELIRRHGYTTPIVAKIEKFEAIDQIDSILSLCDGVMVARGDLGVEMDAEEVPLLQKELIKKANSLGIPIITATQMLDSMASSPRPTRAEVSDVANAILDGTDAVMLSNETAVGDYPIEAVETMAKIARRIERDYPQRALESHLPSTIPNAISAAVSTIARQLNAAAILPLTKSGATAHNVSKFRPATPILAITSEISVARRLQLVWGVSPLLIDAQKSTSKTFGIAMEQAMDMKLLKPGDQVVETAGTLTGISGSTDLIKVGIVSKIVASGKTKPIVKEGTISGKLRVINKATDLSDLKSGEILVLAENVQYNLDTKTHISAMIFEGEYSLINTNNQIEDNNIIPAIYNVEGACTKFKNGEIVTLDLKDGNIIKGLAQDLKTYN